MALSLIHIFSCSNRSAEGKSVTDRISEKEYSQRVYVDYFGKGEKKRDASIVLNALLFNEIYKKMYIERKRDSFMRQELEERCV